MRFFTIWVFKFMNFKSGGLPWASFSDEFIKFIVLVHQKKVRMPSMAIFFNADMTLMYLSMWLMCVTLTDFQAKSPIFLNLLFHHSRTVVPVVLDTQKSVASNRTCQISSKLKWNKKFAYDRTNKVKYEIRTYWDWFNNFHLIEAPRSKKNK